LRHFKHGLGTILAVGLVYGSVHLVQATPLVGTSFSGVDGAVLYDIDLSTGAASNPRSTGAPQLVGIAFSAGLQLFGLSNSAAPTNPGSLFEIDLGTGAAQLVGATGLDSIIEGDLAFDPTSGALYGIYHLDVAQRKLFTIDTGTGAATPLPGSLSGDPSAMAFDAAGTLYAIDTSLDELLTVDKATGNPLSYTSLNVDLGAVAGMDFDPATGTLYVADGESGGTDTLYTVNTTTGDLTAVGSLGLEAGLAGLAFVPEPATLTLAGLGALALIRRRRRR
jgi:hypothetical protein